VSPATDYIRDSATTDVKAMWVWGEAKVNVRRGLCENIFPMEDKQRIFLNLASVGDLEMQNCNRVGSLYVVVHVCCCRYARLALCHVGSKIGHNKATVHYLPT
jgi:hypothetical protein